MALDVGTIEAKVKADASGFRRGLGRARQGLNKFAGMASRGAAVVGGLGAVLAGDTIRQTAKFEKKITEAATKINATSGELETLKESAMEAGRQSRFSGVEAAEALTFLGQAGFDASQQVKALPDVLSLASAENMNLANAADIASNVLKGFRKETSSLSRVGDILTKTSQSANTNINQLGQAMSFAAPTAHSLGVSVAETATFIGKLSDAGIQSTRAGRAMRMVFAKTKKAINDLGADISMSEVRSQSFAQTLGDLKDAGLDADNAMDIFGATAGTAMQVLIAEGVPALEEFTDEMKDSQGVMQRAADRQLQTLSGKFNQLIGSVRIAQSSLGSSLNPTLRTSLDIMRKYADAVSTADENWAGLVKTVKRIPEDAMQVLGGALFDMTGLSNLGAPGIDDALKNIETEQSRQEIIDEGIRLGTIDKEGKTIATSIARRASNNGQRGLVESNFRAAGRGLQIMLPGGVGPIETLAGGKTTDQIAYSDEEIAQIQRQNHLRRLAKKHGLEFLTNMPSAGQDNVFGLSEKKRQKAGKPFDALKLTSEYLNESSGKLEESAKELKKPDKDPTPDPAPGPRPRPKRAFERATSIADTGFTRGEREKGQEEDKRKRERRRKERKRQSAIERAMDKRERGTKAGITESISKAKSEQEQFNRAVQVTADSFVSLTRSIENAAGASNKLSGTLGSVISGVTTGAALGGGVGGVIAGGLTAISGLVDTFSGGDQAQKSKNVRRRQAIKEFTQQNAKAIADELERREVGPTVIQVGPGGALSETGGGGGSIDQAVMDEIISGLENASQRQEINI